LLRFDRLKRVVKEHWIFLPAAIHDRQIRAVVPSQRRPLTSQCRRVTSESRAVQGRRVCERAHSHGERQLTVLELFLWFIGESPAQLIAATSCTAKLNRRVPAQATRVRQSCTQPRSKP
jgi:hypothetical protein